MRIHPPAASAVSWFAAILFLVASAPAQVPDLNIERVASGLDAPLMVFAPPSDARRLFVTEQEGRIRVIKDGELLVTPFLDISAKVHVNNTKLNGLMGAAFDPDYRSNGWVYVYYSQLDADMVLERYTVSATDPNVADPASVVTIFGPVTSPGVSYHAGSGPVFDGDGLLYLAIGDERTIASTNCRAQEGDSYLGKLLRLTKRGLAPPDNPFVGDPTVLDEIYAFGLRSPYRFGIDTVSGDIYIADVGENTTEEINVIPGGSGGGQNFGWAVREGSECTGLPKCSALACMDPVFTDPIFQYPHGHTCCVIGGGVYNGTAIPDLQGMFLFSDFCSHNVWGLRHEGGELASFKDFTGTLTPGPGQSLDRITGFGFDGLGEMYVVDGFGKEGPNHGEVFKLLRSPFQDLGQALDGIHGPPLLLAEGSLKSGTEFRLTLLEFLGNTQIHLVVGLSAINSPFAGGVIVPSPDLLLLNQQTDSSGQIELVTNWAPGIPPNTVLYVQYWGPDASRPLGWAASNALQLTTP